MAFVIWNFPALGGLEYVSQKDIRAYLLCKNVSYLHFLFLHLIMKFQPCCHLPAFKVLSKKQRKQYLVFNDLCTKQRN